MASRLLGIVRQQVIANYWGGSLEASAFFAAARIPTLIYDLLVGGMLSAALVPVLSGYATRDRDEFWRAASVLLSVATAVCAAAAAVVFLAAGPLASFLAGRDPVAVAIVERSLRLLTPAIVLFGVAGVLNGLLYALERFSLPAATGAAYNAGFIVAAIALRGRLGVYALPLGIALGALTQVAILVPGVVQGRLRPRIDWHHPALRRVVRLYLPIGAGLLISMLQGGVEPRLASRWGAEGLSWMVFATNLIQFPHGLIAMAISAAILPRLSAHHVREEFASFGETLARGLRAVVALTLPAAVGLAVLAQPVAGLVFQHGQFDSTDRVAVAHALYGYLLGLPFASIDWPLNYAFYARQNTFIPAAVGVAAIGAWALVAVTLPAISLRHVPAACAPPLGYLGLVLADSAKQAVHAFVMLYLIHRVTKGRALAGVPRTLAKAGAASLVMGAAVFAFDARLATMVPAGTTGWGLRAGLGLTLGVGIYAAAAAILGIDEIGWITRTVRRRFGG